MVSSRHERGTIALEFALLLPVALLFIGTLTITGMRGVYSALAAHEARLAAREASIRLGPSPSTSYPSAGAICSSGKWDLAFPGSERTGCVLSNSPPVAESAWGTGDVVTVTLTYDLTLLNALSSFVANSFSVSDLAVISHSASVMRE